MGQNQSNSSNNAKTAKEQKPQESDESDDDGMPKLVNEASAFVIVNVKFEKPDGTSDTKRFKVGTSDRKINQVKRDLEKQFNIPENKIRVYLENGKEEMPDDCTLYDLGIIDDTNLIVHDGSEQYD
ncbi:hypothetical protein RRG08_030271 [Elysia crispata]|uniref:Ubiquitin-like domain-containing protein n=1 Tax=Elysia crispata TaxID=231223 RepID=A0AAE1DZB5_9GAST|nr:hypothetical protein RRG08_030271 [Elysia crispata]